MTDIVERLRHRARSHVDGFPVTLVYTEEAQGDDREAADEITRLRSALATAETERDASNNLVKLLRADLLKFIGSDPIMCEGCGAPIDHDEEPATTADVHGCWGYVSDVTDAPCYRYRTEQGVDRAWPPCAVLSVPKAEG